MLDSLASFISKKSAVEEHYFNINYIRFVDDAKPYKRGTVIFSDGKIIPPYPRIGRFFILEEGIKKFFKEPYYIEEKADGYNIRITHYEGTPLAITRGGFVCPFSTDRLQDFFPFKDFFSKFPDLILCGEIVGPDNPYMELHPPYIQSDITFKLFDVYNLSENRFLLPEERYTLTGFINIEEVRCFGKYSTEEINDVRDLISKINEEGIEGVVFKSSEKKLRYFKYSTPEINIKDIEADIDLLLELPAEFFIQRLVRYALAASELNCHNSKNANRIGTIFTDSFMKILEEFKSKGKISREYTLYFNIYENIDEFLELENRASSLIKTRVISVENCGSKFKVTIEKTFLKATSKLSRLIRGLPLYD
ncbi:MAG: RNA ligase [Candidatus Hydrothermia bacterium]|nr:RNA ligase [Candidatus Hydrothermia bacterium]